MLVLSRRVNERLLLPNLNISVQIVAAKPGVVRLGIEAPPDVPVYREEIFDRAAWEARERQTPSSPHARLHKLLHALRNRLNASTIGLALLRRQLQMGLVGDMMETLATVERELFAVREQVSNVSEPAAAKPGNRRRALLVEDDRNECELLAGFLRLAGMDVATAGDGADALDYLRQHRRPDVVLLDMILPRCDGPSTVRAIRGDPALNGMKIFGVSGMDPTRFGLSAGPGGVDGWFCKPLNPEDLLRTLKGSLGEAP